MDDNQKLLQQDFLRCKDSPDFLRRRYLRLRDRDDPSMFVPFVARFTQQRISQHVAEHGASFILKYRRTGCSRMVMSDWFHAAHFLQVPVISCFHNETDAKDAFQQVRDWYANLPGHLKQGVYALKTNRADLMEWKHGGVYKVTWDQAAPAGTHTWVLRHYSEVGKFKDDETIRVIEGGVSKYGRLVYETTADGLGLAYALWNRDNGLAKLFLPWMEDPGYSMTPGEVKRAGHKPGSIITPVIDKYGKEWGLSEGQKLWMGVKLAALGKDRKNPRGMMRGFHSEFPASPQLAFQSASGRCFEPYFEDGEEFGGARQYAKPEPYHVYTIGVDTGAGVPGGDFSAATVMDWTDRENPQIMYVFYDRVQTTIYEAVLMELHRAYNNALMVVERNSLGLSLIPRLQVLGCDNFYVQEKVNVIDGGVTDRLGFQTGDVAKHIMLNLLKSYIDADLLDLRDPRLKYEVNHVTYNDKEKMEAKKPHHDDGMDSLALALLGGDQIMLAQQQTMLRRPQTRQEWHHYNALVEEHPEIAAQGFEPDWFEEFLGETNDGLSVHDGARIR